MGDISGVIIPREIETEEWEGVIHIDIKELRLLVFFMYVKAYAHLRLLHGDNRRKYMPRVSAFLLYPTLIQQREGEAVWSMSLMMQGGLHDGLSRYDLGKTNVDCCMRPYMQQLEYRWAEQDLRTQQEVQG